MKQEQNSKGRHPDPAIELAILNGIEAYNREQRAKQNTGETRTKEAMEEAGLKPRRRSRAKGKGTRLPETDGSAAPAAPAAEAAGGQPQIGRAHV